MANNSIHNRLARLEAPLQPRRGVSSQVMRFLLAPEAHPLACRIADTPPGDERDALCEQLATTYATWAPTAQEFQP